MARVALLVVVASLCVWALALLGPSRPRGKHSAAQAEPSAPQQAEPSSTSPAAHATPSASSTPPREADLDEPAVKASEPRPRISDEPTARAPRGSAEPSLRRLQTQSEVAQLSPDPSEGEPSPPAGEQGEGLLSPEYREREEDYMYEPRLADWAHAHEHRMRGVIRDAGLIPKLVLVHCRQETCRLVMERADAAEVSELLEVPGLRAATGLVDTPPYSLRGGQLTLYFRPGAAPSP